MDAGAIRSLGTGLSQRGVRDHNERLILTLLQRQGQMPGSDIARQTGLSATTVSAIMRGLLEDGYLRQGAPVRGKVGKPSVPLSLEPESVLSLGLSVGRRSTVLMLLDFCGNVLWRQGMTHDIPQPDIIFDFFAREFAALKSRLGAEKASRLCGVGVAAPSELWLWHEQMGATAEQVEAWREEVIPQRIAGLSGLPVEVINDATAACKAEHIYGMGKSLGDYAYIYMGTLIGGGVVLNNTIYEGRTGNAGAIGPLRTVGPSGAPAQLLDTASLHLLEASMSADGLDPAGLRESPGDWSAYESHVAPWIDTTAAELALASLSICAVIDFQSMVIDGVMPADVRARLVARTQAHQAKADQRGVVPPQIRQGTIGPDARAIGAASKPIFAEFFLDTHGGLHGG